MFYSLIFFTTWVVILVVFHQYTHKYVDLLYLSFLAFFVGSYLSFVKPGFYTLPLTKKENIIFYGWHRFIIIDISIHLFFLCFVYYFYFSFYQKKYQKNTNINPLVASICLLILYMNTLSFSGIKQVYKIDLIELFFISLIATLVYFYIIYCL